jgi:hypothetical protein
MSLPLLVIGNYQGMYSYSLFLPIVLISIDVYFVILNFFFFLQIIHYFKSKLHARSCVSHCFREHMVLGFFSKEGSFSVTAHWCLHTCYCNIFTNKTSCKLHARSCVSHCFREHMVLGFFSLEI